MANYTLKITSVSKLSVQDTGETLLSVQFQILKDTVVEITLRHGFPIDCDQGAIILELNKVLATYLSDKENIERNRRDEANSAKADETISSIVGLEIKQS